MISACPRCDDSSIVHSKQSSMVDDTEEYRCTACGHSFAEPTERERRGHSGVKGLAAKLDKMDADSL